MGNVTINLRPLNAFEAAIRDGLTAKQSGRAIDRGFKVIGAMYRAWSQERFAVLSRGGGEWPPLKPSTIARRRHGKGAHVRTKGKGRHRRTVRFKAGTVAILRDTNTLFGALDARLNVGKGGFEERIRFGIRLGYGGGAMHPGDKLTTSAIASFHQAGGGHLPQRRIIVKPPAAEVARYGNVMGEALQKEWDRVTK